LLRVALAILLIVVVLPIVAGPLGLGAAPLPPAGHIGHDCERLSLEYH
jgi:hypothetical protein